MDDAPRDPRWLYLHGFASGPDSTKGVAMSDHYARRGVALLRLDLRLPSFEHLRLSAMMAALGEAIGGPRDRAVVFGSSLGALTAARVAEADPRIAALVLLAPAFRLAERWRANLGEAGWARWRERGELPVEDYVRGRTSSVDFGFIEEVARLDGEGGGWPDVRVPTLIVHGRADEVVDIDVARRWTHGRRHVRLVEVDDGHELRASLPTIQREADRFLEPFLNF